MERSAQLFLIMESDLYSNIGNIIGGDAFVINYYDFHRNSLLRTRRAWLIVIILFQLCLGMIMVEVL